MFTVGRNEKNTLKCNKLVSLLIFVSYIIFWEFLMIQILQLVNMRKHQKLSCGRTKMNPKSHSSIGFKEV